MTSRSYENSKLLHDRASKVLVGGVNSPVRSFKRVGRHPILAREGKGAKIIDVDGNVYLDFVMSYGPHLFGHGRMEIIKAAREAMEKSPCLGMTHENEILWAEKLLERIPTAEKVRAVSSGTEACTTAIRLARGYTKRSVVVKFSGNYHGHVDSLLMSAGSGVATISHPESAVPECAGIPEGLSRYSKVLSYNDVESVKTLFSEMGDQIAAVILEPVVGNMGVIPPTIDFLRTLRAETEKAGALLIFDEVMTGLRVHRLSAQGLYNIRPDLSCFGKVVGGGFPLAAIAGPAKIMDTLAPLGPVYQAGTLSGNPVGIAAGLAMMKLIDEIKPYEKLEQMSAQMESVLLDCAKSKGLPMTVNRVGSMLSPFFQERKVTNAQDAEASNAEIFNRFFWAALEEGWMLAPSPYEAWFLSFAHDEVSENRFAESAQRIFAKI